MLIIYQKLCISQMRKCWLHTKKFENLNCWLNYQIHTSPYKKWLLNKLILIFGIYGAAEEITWVVWLWNTLKIIADFGRFDCFAQHAGCQTISGRTIIIAEYLNLENPDDYTGHSLRRFSTPLLVEGGGDLLTLKRHRGLRSSTVTEGYIEESVRRKIEASRKFFSHSRTVKATPT